MWCQRITDFFVLPFQNDSNKNVDRSHKCVWNSNRIGNNQRQNSHKLNIELYLVGLFSLNSFSTLHKASCYVFYVNKSENSIQTV